MNLEKLNSVRVKPVIFPNQNNCPIIAGHDMFPEPYGNIYILGKKKSGKSSLVYNILKNCTGKNTMVFVFGSTINKDPTYKEIFEMFKKRKISYEKFIHFVDGKENILEDIINSLKNEKSDEDNSEIEIEKKICLFDNERKNEKKKEKKIKKLYPEFIFLFDDLGSDLRNKAIDILCKTNRHLKSKVILCGHTLNDLNPGCRKQLDFVLVFRCLTDEKLDTLHNDLDLSISEDEFKEAYQYATKEPFNFLYISTKDDQLRKNFNLKISFD